MGKIPAAKAAIGINAMRPPSNKSTDIGPAMERVFEGRARFANLIGIAVWTATMTFFWLWWLRSDHVIGWPSYLLVTLVLAWSTGLPAYFIFIVHDARRMPQGGGPLPAGRIAVVVNRASSEPLPVVQATLRAVLDQVGCDFDVWLADENPSLDMMKWCIEHGVFTSMTRKGVEATAHDPSPRCKQAILASFYDRFGYEKYDFVVQLDADHVPDKSFLREMIRPFRDPGIGYVSAPGIRDANATSSWAARGRLFAGAGSRGLLQAGYNNGWAPLCLGMHYAVRTAALKEIGGLEPEPTEGHSTTLAMNAGGWGGVHALDAIAHSGGPATFVDLVVQEFDRSRSRITTLLRYSPIHMSKLPGWLKFQFLFSQLWYPLFSFGLAVIFTLPIIALVTGHSFVDVTYPAFLLHFLPIVGALIALAFFWRATGTFRPANAKILSWESMAFLLLRWPWSLMGCAVAIRDYLTHSSSDFRVTPRELAAAQVLPLRVLAPYIVLSLLSALAMVFAVDREAAQGLFIFAAINALIYGALIVLIIVRHAMENTLSR
ncbi:cellulose synthase (UDP-forming) [Rhizobium sp. BK313]|nr:cellulose synthase (UDP-forming) [Rhizobium sp. BK313]